jgi:hypothetical protein
MSWIIVANETNGGKQKTWISHPTWYVDMVEGNDVPAESDRDTNGSIGEKGGMAAVTGIGSEPTLRLFEESAKLNRLIDQSHCVLLNISAVFPFDFFPDQVTIDENKVNIVERMFFWSEYIHSVMIKDIMNVVVQSGLFFATLQLIPIGHGDIPIEVRYLKRHDAIRARRIIQGLIAAKKANIDLTALPKKVLTEKIEELGIAQDTLESSS